jgi:hypothetical protein
MGLNIRVVIYNGEYKFWITEGYVHTSKNVKRALIRHCPFCGQKLNLIYSDEKYINEDVETLMKVFY